MPASNNYPRRVVITGLGLVSPIGNSPQQLWASLSEGRSGVACLQSLPPLKGRVVFGGEAQEFSGAIGDFGELTKETKKAIRKALKIMCRESKMGIAAAQHAAQDAGFGETPMDPDRSGVVFGSDYMLSPPEDFVDGMVKCGISQGGWEHDRWGQDGLREMNPLWMLKFLPNMPASHIAIFNDLRGPNNSLTLREISGLMALREATHTIQRGHADRMIAGATGTRLHCFKTVHACQSETLADPGLEPEQAARPFEKTRTGMVLGEGAGAVLLEERQAALARNATIYGEITGSGSSTVTDANLRANSRQALAGAARSAMAEADVQPAALGHVNAHGLGTIKGDRDEAGAIADLLGSATAQVPVVAAKSYFGNLGAGSCVVELIASLVGLSQGRLFRTLNYQQPDPQCPLAVVAGEEVPSGANFLKLAVTPQGQASALLVARAD